MNSGKFAAFLPDLFFYTVNLIANKKRTLRKGRALNMQKVTI